MEHEQILSLLKEKEIIETQLQSLIYGAIEIREKDNKRYLYVHYRDNGIALTKYVGEYSEDLSNLVLNNSLKAKDLKKRLKAITKQLTECHYIEPELDFKVSLNIDIARRHLVKTIYQQAILEGVATTYSDTETIIEGGKVKNMTSDDIMKVVNLKRAWEFILNKNVISAPLNLGLVCEINKIIEAGFYYNAGQIRSVPVAIGGTTWKPAIPISSVVQEEIQAILNSGRPVLDQAIDILLYLMKKQIFLDGNKRTAVLVANHLLISHGLGIIVIPETAVEKYKELLIAYYEGKDECAIKNFLREESYLKL